MYKVGEIVTAKIIIKAGGTPEIKQFMIASIFKNNIVNYLVLENERSCDYSFLIDEDCIIFSAYKIPNPIFDGTNLIGKYGLWLIDSDIVSSKPKCHICKKYE